MKKISTSIVLMCSLVSFNAYASNAETSPANRSTSISKNMQFEVFNDTGVKINNIDIVDGNNKRIYQSYLVCEQAKICHVNAGTQMHTTPLTFKFYGNDNKLVSAYILSDTTSASISIPANDSGLGVYLFNQMKKETGTDASELNTKLIRFFSNYSPSPDNMPDIFEELGLYYIAKTSQKSMTEKQFFSNLNGELDKGIILKANQPAMMVAYSPSLKVSAAKCSPVISGMVDYLSVFGKIPGSTGIGITITTKIMSNLCGGGTSLSDISNQLNIMDEKLNALGFKTDDIANLISDTTMKQQYKEINLAFNKVQASNNEYTAFLAGTGATSLAAYAKSYRGGLKAIMQNNSNQLVLRDNIFKNIKSQITDFQNLTDQTRLEAFAKSIKDLCSDPNKINVDVIERRNQCNVAVAQVTAKIIGSSEIINKMIKDEVTAINDVNDPAWASVTFSNPYGGKWSDVGPKIDAILNNAISGVDSNLYNKQSPAVIEPLTGANSYLVLMYQEALNKSLPRYKAIYDQSPATYNVTVKWYTNTQNPNVPTKYKDMCIERTSNNSRKALDGILKNCILLITANSYYPDGRPKENFTYMTEKHYTQQAFHGVLTSGYTNKDFWDCREIVKDKKKVSCQ